MVSEISFLSPAYAVGGCDEVVVDEGRTGGKTTPTAAAGLAGSSAAVSLSVAVVEVIVVVVGVRGVVGEVAGVAVSPVTETVTAGETLGAVMLVLVPLLAESEGVGTFVLAGSLAVLVTVTAGVVRSTATCVGALVAC